jgi:hypothetical protein
LESSQELGLERLARAGFYFGFLFLVGRGMIVVAVIVAVIVVLVIVVLVVVEMVSNDAHLFG